MYDLGVSYTFYFHKKDYGIIFNILRSGVVILNGKENEEAGAICFEIRILRRNNKKLLRKVPKGIFIMEKTKTIFGL